MSKKYVVKMDVDRIPLPAAHQEVWKAAMNILYELFVEFNKQASTHKNDKPSTSEEIESYDRNNISALG